MDKYWLAQIKSKYPIDSGYSPDEKKYIDSLFQWPSNKYCKPLEREKHILTEALSPPELISGTLADQVFGRQAHQEKLHLVHAVNLLADRYELLKRHVSDIRHRNMDVQEGLSIERMRSPGDANRHQRDLEKLLVNLEAQKRDEETGFWKDTMKIRQELLTGAQEYQASRHRADILANLEVKYDEGL